MEMGLDLEEMERRIEENEEFLVKLSDEVENELNESDIGRMDAIRSIKKHVLVEKGNYEVDGVSSISLMGINDQPSFHSLYNVKGTSSKDIRPL
jgi:hypothetical protein